MTTSREASASKNGKERSGQNPIVAAPAKPSWADLALIFQSPTANSPAGKFILKLQLGTKFTPTAFLHCRSA